MDSTATSYKTHALLCEACKTDDRDLVKQMIKYRDVNINSWDKNLTTPLIYAAEKGHFEVVKILASCSSLDPNKGSLKKLVIFGHCPKD